MWDKKDALVTSTGDGKEYLKSLVSSYSLNPRMTSDYLKQRKFMENYKETNSFQEQIDIKVNPTFHDNNY